MKPLCWFSIGGNDFQFFAVGERVIVRVRYCYGPKSRIRMYSYSHMQLSAVLNFGRIHPHYTRYGLQLKKEKGL